MGGITGSIYSGSALGRNKVSSRATIRGWVQLRGRRVARAHSSTSLFSTTSTCISVIRCRAQLLMLFAFSTCSRGTYTYGMLGCDFIHSMVVCHLQAWHGRVPFASMTWSCAICNHGMRMGHMHRCHFNVEHQAHVHQTLSRTLCPAPSRPPSPTLCPTPSATSSPTLCPIDPIHSGRGHAEPNSNMVLKAAF